MKKLATAVVIMLIVSTPLLFLQSGSSAEIVVRPPDGAPLTEGEPFGVTRVFTLNLVVGQSYDINLYSLGPWTAWSIEDNARIEIPGMTWEGPNGTTDHFSQKLEQFPHNHSVSGIPLAPLFTPVIRVYDFPGTIGYEVRFNVSGGTPLQFTYNPPAGNLIAERLWTHKIVQEDGASVALSGSNISWLTANGSTLGGTPPAAGDYAVTVTVSKAGYVTLTETFTLHVVSQLVPTNSPTAGAIIYVV